MCWYMHCWANIMQNCDFFFFNVKSAPWLRKQVKITKENPKQNNFLLLILNLKKQKKNLHMQHKTRETILNNICARMSSESPLVALFSVFKSTIKSVTKAQLTPEQRFKPFSWSPATSAAGVRGESGWHDREAASCVFNSKPRCVSLSCSSGKNTKAKGGTLAGDGVGVRRPGGRQRSCLLCLTLGRSELWGRRASEQMESKRRAWGRRTGDLLTLASVSVPQPLLHRSALACGPNVLPFIVRTVCTRLRCCSAGLVGFI